jgi:copper chaperone CopZ
MPVLILVAGVAAGWIAWRAQAPHREAASVKPIPRVLTEAPAEGEVVRVYDVEGMCCVSCSGKLHAALLEVSGVHAAAVDFDAGTASVLAEETVAPDDLQAALEFDKYTAKARP